MAHESAKAVRAISMRRSWQGELLLAAGLGAVGWLGFAGGANSKETISAALVWLGLSSAALGFFAGRCLRIALWPLPPILWFAALAWFSKSWSGPSLAVLASGSLYSLGAFFAECRRVGSAQMSSTPWAGAACLLFLAGALAALPSAGGILAQPLPLEWTAHLMNLSPVVWVAESAGLDWMRHPSVYEIAQAGDLGPELRVAWSGWTAPLCALGACGLLIGATRGRRLFT